MKAAFRATKPSECWDWLSGADVSRLANQAYRTAKAASHPPKGQTFLAGGAGWCDPAQFAETLTRLLVLHVQAHAHGAGIPGNEYAPAQLSKWYEPGGEA